MKIIESVPLFHYHFYFLHVFCISHLPGTSCYLNFLYNSLVQLRRSRAKRNYNKTHIIKETETMGDCRVDSVFSDSPLQAGNLSDSGCHGLWFLLLSSKVAQRHLKGVLSIGKLMVRRWEGLGFL